MPGSGSNNAFAEEHLRRVQAVTDAALAHLTLESLLDELLSRSRDLLHADTAAILLLDESARELVATAAKGIEEEVEQGVRLPVGAGFAGRIAATGKPVVLDKVDHEKVLNPLLVKRGIHSMLGVPLIVDGAITGVLHVGTLNLRLFNEEDVELLQLAADRIALAVHARRQHEQRAVADTIQRSLLPDRFPRLKGIEIAGHYQPGEGGVVGGDWYDVFVLKSDLVCVVVGDIAGRGVQAAVAMGRLRNTVRALAFIDGTPGGCVTRLNDFLLHFDPGVMGTVLVGMIDSHGKMRYANAGHLPPVVINEEGRARLVEESAEPPLGASDFWSYRERELILGSGSTLILYTDGLVERRGRSMDDGLEALRRAAETPWTNLDMLCAQVFQEIGFESSDDLAVLTIRMDTDRSSRDIHTTIDADPRGLAPLRRLLRGWLAACEADDQQSQDVLVAVGEAVANSIEHAHGPGRGSIQIDARQIDGFLEITIRDQGVWREPRGSNRGLGRSIMGAMMDEVSFDANEKGTVVKLRKRLP